MSLFIETIKYENGEYLNLALHQKRIDRTFQEFFPKTNVLNLKDILSYNFQQGIHKIRVEYDEASFKIDSREYLNKHINSMGLVESSLEYSFKYSDRSEINELLETSRFDEIIIIKNGMVTDSSYANLAFFDGEKWWTPRSPLLYGVKRSKLIAEGMINELDISYNDIQHFKKVSLINAMLDLDDLSFVLKDIDL